MRKINNEKWHKAVELLAAGNKTYIEVAEIVGVDPNTLRTWRKDEKFQDEVKKRCRELLKEMEPDLYAVAFKNAKKDKAAHQYIKLLLDRIERLEDIAEGRGREYDVMFTWKDGTDKIG